MDRKVFINLPVADLERSMSFFSSLDFEFNPQFSDDTAACMIITDSIFVMLLTAEKFATFTPNEICDATQQSEVLVCLSCSSRVEVDETVHNAISAGGSLYSEAADHGFMYGHGFQDLDGHIWELVFMDEEAMSNL